MARLITIIIILLLSFLNSFSQSLKGEIIDIDTNEPIPYATVILKNLKGEFLEGVTTDDNGIYNIDYQYGKYDIEASFIGYETYMSSVVIDKNTTLDITMKTEATALDEVTLVAEETTVKQLIDKKVVHVGKDLLSSGGDAATVLSQLSEVQADQNGNISLRGSQNVNVLVNGKPSPLSTTELLQQIPSDEINKIEIITSPSAKYQANGLTGIINIITNKKVRKGAVITTSLNGNSLGSYGANGGISYGRSKTSYRLGGSYKKNIFENENTQNRSGIQPFTQLSDFKFDGEVYKVNGGIDWFPNDDNEFSLGLDYTDNGHILDNKANIFQNDVNIFQNTLGSHSHKTFNANGNYRRYFKERENFLEIDIQLSDNANVLKSDFRPNLGIIDNATDNDVFITNLAMDYSGALSEKFKIEAGTFWNRQNLDNSRSFFDADNISLSEESFENTQSTYAAYTLIKYNLKGVNIQAGVRGELFARKANLKTDNTSIENDFTNLFPSLHLSYTIKEDQTLIFGYNRRTSRPTLSQVNPIAFQVNEFSISQGNPALEPEFSNNFDVSYQFKRKILKITPAFAYRLKENVITTNNYVNDDGINVFTSVNNGATNAYGIEMAINIKPYKWVNTDLNFNWNYEEFKNDQIGFTHNFNRSYNLTLKNQFTLSQKTNLVVSWRYNGPSKGFFYTQEVAQKIDLGIRHKILKNKGNINLRITDFFNTQSFEGINSGNEFSQSYAYKPTSRVVHLAFSYRIDGGTVKQRNKKSRRYNSGLID